MTSAPATVSLDVVDPPPIGVPVTYATRENLPLTVPAAQGVLAGDTDSAGDPLTATLQTTVTHGTLVLNSNGSFTYTPPASFTGSVSFTYVPHGTYTAGSPTTVTIVVGQGNGAPPPPPPVTGEAAPPPPPLADPPSQSGTGGSGNSLAVATVGSASVVPVAPQPVTPAPLPPTPVATSPTTTVASLPSNTASASSVTDSSPIVQPDSSDSGTDPYVDATGLLSVPDPILLPDVTLAGDASFALMLPASPEIAQLPEAFALAAQRLTARPPTVITFVDPVTGQASDDTDPTDRQGAPDPAWLLLDADDDAGMGTVPSQIRWDSAPP
jgi:hypothetical protein